MSEPECHECGAPVSYDTGSTMTGGLGDNSLDRIWCPEHAPKQGKGYTLADMQQWREDSQVARAAYDTHLMEMMGPDVYFAVLAGRERAEKRAKMRRYHRTLQGVVDTLKRIDAID